MLEIGSNKFYESKLKGSRGKTWTKVAEDVLKDRGK